VCLAFGRARSGAKREPERNDLTRTTLIRGLAYSVVFPEVRSVRCRLVPFALLLLGVTSIDAQIIRRPTSIRPQNWITGSVGYVQLGTVTDGSTDSQWDFGDGAQFRAGLQHVLQGSAAVGVGATFGRVPLTYRSLSATSPCARCDADAYVTQVLGQFHYGGSTLGFHQVIDLAIGATGFSNFRTRVGDEKIGPEGMDWDLALAFGYGFGYAMSPLLQLQIVQEVGRSIHQREGLEGGANTMTEMYVTRIGIRYGLGR
jgi:hypothetical protein